MSRLFILMAVGFFSAILAGCNTTGSINNTPREICCTNCASDGCCQGDCCGEADCGDCGACSDCKARSTGVTLEQPAADSDLAVIIAGGMGCPLCSSSAEKQLERLDGVTEIRVNLGTGELWVGVDPGVRPSAEQLAQAVTDGGFTVKSVSWRKAEAK